MLSRGLDGCYLFLVGIDLVRVMDDFVPNLLSVPGKLLIPSLFVHTYMEKRYLLYSRNCNREQSMLMHFKEMAPSCDA